MKPWFKIVGLVGVVAIAAGATSQAREGGSVAAEVVVLDEAGLRDALFTHIDEGRAPVLTVTFGESIVYEARAREGETIALTLRSESDALTAPPIPWHWSRIPFASRLRLLDQLPPSADVRFGIARSCLENGRSDEGHQRLHDLVTADPTLRPVVDGLLRDVLEVENPDESFEWFDGRFVQPAEKRSLLVRQAEAWLMDLRAKEDESYARGDALYAKARWFQTKGFFEIARGMFRKLARMSPDSDIGREAAQQVADNTFLLQVPVGRQGPSENRVDIVVLGDGYELDDRHQNAYRRAVDLMIEYLLDTEVIGEYASYFNFHRIHTSSKEDGVDNDTQDFSTALGGKWSGFSQGQVTVDHGLVVRMLAAHRVAWDNAMVMVKRGGGGTGGGRIAAFAHGSTGTAYHEFGHSFASLLDEYNTQVSDTPRLGGAPRGWNISDGPDPANAPWAHWIEAKEPGIGMFRGGAAGAEGAYRPTASGCVMNAGNDFCAVCREQVVRTIYRYVRPIEGALPDPDETIRVLPQRQVTFEVRVLKPTSRILEVTWLFNGAPLEGHPRKRVLEEGGGSVRESITVTLEGLKIAKGYRGVLTARVRDTTPWVLEDPDDLLEQSVSWTLEPPDVKERTTSGGKAVVEPTPEPAGDGDEESNTESDGDDSDSEAKAEESVVEVEVISEVTEGVAVPLHPLQVRLAEAKALVGAGVVASDPRERRRAFEAANRQFGTVLDAGPDTEVSWLEEARDYRRALQTGIDANRLAENAVTWRVLVVACNLDGTIRRFNRERYRELAYKVKDRQDPKAAARAREMAMETIRIGTEWNVEDRNYLRSELQRAASFVFDWSRGAIRLEFEIQPLTKRIRDLRSRRGGGRAMWLLGDPDARAGDAGPEEILERIDRFRPESYDLVLLAPKYERGDDALPKPSASSEEGMAFAPIGGRVPVRHLALAARDDGKKLDGSVAAPPFAIAIVDRVYAGMRDSLARAYLRTGYDGPADAAAVARLSSWLPPFDRELERGYHVIQRGEAWYREVLGTWISRGMADSAGAIARAFADAERVRSDGDVSAWFDRDPRTGAVLAGDAAQAVVLRAAKSASEITLVLGRALEPDTRIRLVLGDGVTLEGPSKPGPSALIRLQMPEPLKIREFSIETVCEDAPTSGAVDLREILLR